MIPLTDGMLLAAALASVLLGFSLSSAYRLFLLAVGAVKSVFILSLESIKKNAKGRAILGYKYFRLSEITGIGKEILCFIFIILSVPLIIIANYVILDGAGRLLFPVGILIFALIFYQLSNIGEQKRRALAYLLSLPLLFASAFILKAYRAVFVIVRFLVNKAVGAGRNICKK